MSNDSVANRLNPTTDNYILSLRAIIKLDTYFDWSDLVFDQDDSIDRNGEAILRIDNKKAGRAFMNVIHDADMGKNRFTVSYHRHDNDMDPVIEREYVSILDAIDAYSQICEIVGEIRDSI